MSTDFKRIDIHTHILPRRLPDLSVKYGYPGWISTVDLPDGRQRMMLNGNKFRDIECNCWDADKRIEESEDIIQVLSTVPVLFSYWAEPKHCLDLAQYLNDDIASTCQQNPSKFIGLATLPMQAPELAVQELRRCMLELKMAGIQIGSHINDWNLDAVELEPIWDACEELDCPVFVHPWDMQQDGRMSKYWMPWLVGMPCETTLAMCSLIFGGVLQRHPKLRFCFAHAGGAFPFTIGRIEHGFKCRPDLVATDCKINPTEFLGRFWTDSLCHDEDALDLLIKKVGIDNIILGSDYPFPLGEVKDQGAEYGAGTMIIKSERLTMEQKRKILFTNIFRFFGSRVDIKNFE